MTTTAACHTAAITPSYTEERILAAKAQQDYAEIQSLQEQALRYNRSIADRAQRRNLTDQALATYAKSQLSEADFNDYHQHRANLAQSVRDLGHAVQLAAKARRAAVITLYPLLEDPADNWALRRRIDRQLLDALAADLTSPFGHHSPELRQILATACRINLALTSDMARNLGDHVAAWTRPGV